MARSPQEVADKLAEAAFIEANRLLERARADEMTTGDRIGLQSLWRVAAEAANAEWSQLQKVDPGKFSDALLERALGESVPHKDPPVRKSRRTDG